MFQIFHSQQFIDSSSSTLVSVSGDDILRDVYGMTDIEPWKKLLILFSFIFALRLWHYFLFSKKKCFKCFSM